MELFSAMVFSHSLSWLFFKFIFPKFINNFFRMQFFYPFSLIKSIFFDLDYKDL